MSWKRRFGSQWRAMVLLLKESEVRGLLSMDEVIEAVEEAFLEKAAGQVQMPPKIYVYYSRYDGDLRVMPAYLEGLDISAVKVVNVHPGNRGFGLPSIMATILLVDPQTGAPLSIMSGAWITAMRTGGASGVATKHLARRDSMKLGVIGAGVQGQTQLLAISRVVNLVHVSVFDIDKTRRDEFARREAEHYPGVEITAVDTAQDAVTGMDILVTVTPARSPVVRNEWVEPGLHINAVGADAPGKEELDPMILKRAKIVVDDLDQASHSGEINMPLAKRILRRDNIHGELGEVISRRKPGRESNEEITVFDATGLAILDAITAKLVYKRAVELGRGQEIDLLSALECPDSR